VSDDEVMVVFRRDAAGDLGWRSWRLGCWALTGRSLRTSLAEGRLGVEVALVRTNLDGLKKSLKSFSAPAPLDRLENSAGSTFSESSTSTSEAFLLTGAVEIAIAVS
jgi:hypothetical protein